MKIYAEDKYIDIFTALSSTTRLAIIRLLSEKTYNIKEISGLLGLSSAVITRHIDMLESCGIVESYFVSASHGRQKVCRVKESTITLLLKDKAKRERQLITVPIGSYDCAKDIQSPCGLERDGQNIGIINDPRYFMIPKRDNISHIWFSHGMLQYRLPEQIKGTEINSIKIRFMLTVECHEGKYEKERIIFGICGKQICSHLMETFDTPKEMCITVSSNGVFLMGEKVNESGISEFEFDVSDFSFEIVAGYHHAQKCVIGLYSTLMCPEIEFELEVN